MSPFSGTVLASAGVLASPALYKAFVLDTLPLDVALTRYLIATVIAWAALSVVVELAFSAPPRGPAEQSTDGEPPDAQ